MEERRPSTDMFFLIFDQKGKSPLGQGDTEKKYVIP